MKELARKFPQGVAYAIPFDTTTFVSQAINEVVQNTVRGRLSGAHRHSDLPAGLAGDACPGDDGSGHDHRRVCSDGRHGLPINLSTLFAIVLAIGIVVDDAIVVVEGAAHNIERGMSGHDAAISAMNALFGPIVGITLVLMAVFLPASFVPGLTGQIYAQFALVIAATALISAINAATLKPTQCAMWLRRRYPGKTQRLLSWVQCLYVRAEGSYAAPDRLHGAA